MTAPHPPLCEGAGPCGSGVVPDTTSPLVSTFHVSYCETKGEDVSIVSKSISSFSNVALYAVADGHNGTQAAKAVAATLPGELSRQIGGRLHTPAHPHPEAVRTALARAFVGVDDVVCTKFLQSGCTLTAAVVSGGNVLTVANVGDSRAILDTGAEVVELTAEHRIGASPSELARLEAAGGRLARLNEYGAGPSRGVGDGVGPVRLWPGGIMVGRAIGDRDVGAILLPNPHIRQVKLPPTGARLIIASDGLWDAMPAGRVARVLRSQPTAKCAAMQAVSSVAASLGGLLRDDVTVMVVDFLPQGTRDFREVCKQFQSRLSRVLSDPKLSSLVMEGAGAGPAAGAEEAERPAPQPGPQRRGLFACFSKPMVHDPDFHPRSGSVHGGSARGSGNISARGGSSWGVRSGPFQLNPSASLGGSEKSVRSGVVRDPSVRGCRRATSVELLYEGDTAEWSASDFGRAPSLGCATAAACSRSSSGSSAQRSSPRSLSDSLVFGYSVASISSVEDDSCELPHAVSLAPALSLPLSLGSGRQPGLSRKNSAPVSGEKKCHGSMAAAALLLQARPEV